MNLLMGASLLALAKSIYYWRLIAKIMDVVCEVVAGFLHWVVFTGFW